MPAKLIVDHPRKMALALHRIAVAKTLREAKKLAREALQMDLPLAAPTSSNTVRLTKDST